MITDMEWNCIKQRSIFTLFAPTLKAWRLPKRYTSARTPSTSRSTAISGDAEPCEEEAHRSGGIRRPELGGTAARRGREAAAVVVEEEEEEEEEEAGMEEEKALATSGGEARSGRQRAAAMAEEERRCA
jgi:hypothetical protein